MDVNTKVKELEDELRVLKTEIRNVLLDVREVILDRANPLSEQEPAYLRVDLKTTAQAIAAEEAGRSAAGAAEDAARSAAKAAEQKKAEERPENKLEQIEEPEDSDADGASEDLPIEDELETAEPPADEEPVQAELEEAELEEPEDAAPVEPPPKAEATRKRKRRPEAIPDPADMLPAYHAYLPLAIGTSSLAAWVAEAMAAIGPQQLDRVITIHRLWGCLPPNISQALAHLQELIRCSQDAEPAWLKIMQDMERLSSS